MVRFGGLCSSTNRSLLTLGGVGVLFDSACFHVLGIWIGWSGTVYQILSKDSLDINATFQAVVRTFRLCSKERKLLSYFFLMMCGFSTVGIGLDGSTNSFPAIKRAVFASYGRLWHLTGICRLLR